MISRFAVDPELVRKLAGLLEETGLTEIEYQKGDQRIRVAKGGARELVVAAAGAGAAAAPAATAGASAASEGPPAGALTSPMVGTAYLAPEPGAPPYVKVGDRVRAGQTLLIIEAMKVMNPIAAPQDGTIAEILVSDGRPVEYGEVLMVLR